MEVRIKQGTEMLDATIEMVDGVMVVSPKVEKYMYKEGDVIIVRTLYKHIFIYKESENGYLYSFADLINDLLDLEETPVCMENDIKEIRSATEEEKKLLFNKLKEEGYEWDAENKKLIKLKWRPKEGGSFWMPYHYVISVEFRPCNSLFNKGRDEVLLNKGWCFKTDAECQAFCDKLNKTIEGVKS